jgi:hypothetical protein
MKVMTKSQQIELLKAHRRFLVTEADVQIATERHAQSVKNLTATISRIGKSLHIDPNVFGIDLENVTWKERKTCPQD